PGGLGEAGPRPGRPRPAQRGRIVPRHRPPLRRHGRPHRGHPSQAARRAGRAGPGPDLRLRGRRPGGDGRPGTPLTGPAARPPGRTGAPLRYPPRLHTPGPGPSRNPHEPVTSEPYDPDPTGGRAPSSRAAAERLGVRGPYVMAARSSPLHASGAAPCPLGPSLPPPVTRTAPPPRP